MNRFPKILYWKWDEKTPSYLDFGLNDCISRFDFDLLYVSFHHLPLAFGDERLTDLLLRTISTLAQHGKKLLLDIDARNELAAFLALHPDGEGQNVRFWEYKLDENGKVSFTKENYTSGRTGRARKCEAPVSFAGAWIIDKCGEHEYSPGSLAKLPTSAISYVPHSTKHNKIQDKTEVQSLSAVDIGFGTKPSSDMGESCNYTIDAGKDAAGKTVIILPVFKHGIPDLFSLHLDSFYSGLFEHVADLALGGAATDEWGWDLALMNDDGLFYVDVFPYSAGFKLKYHERTGRCLDEDLIHFVCHPRGDISQSIFTANAYISTLRTRMEENNRWFYDETKRRFGKDAFVGVHPTLWGDYSDFSVDIIHNGLSWWEVPRDFAQTDEFVAMPIRTALAHKWGGPVFYNMWYSGNTQQLDTYWRETWNNARFGGRTHYLGYECPNEPGVFRLKHPGALEGVELMERKITDIDMLQKSQPDCRVAVVFGIEGVSCFAPGRGKITRGCGVLPEMVKFASALFEACLCDLIPSSEIANGSLKLDAGRAVYGSQVYDMVVYIEPEYMDKIVLAKLENFAKHDGKLVLYGNCTRFNDGADVRDEFKKLTSMATFYSKTRLSPLETLQIIDNHNIPRNRFKNGCVYQDGSVIFTADAVKPTGNILEVDVVHKGRRILFTGEDYLYVGVDGKCEPSA